MVSAEDLTKALRRANDVMPAGTFYHSVDVEELDTLTREALSKNGKYSNIQLVKWPNGGREDIPNGVIDHSSKTRMIYSADWGTEGSKKPVVIKVDMPDYLLGVRAQKHFANGNNTKNEIASLMEIDHPNIVHLRDFYEVQASNGEKVHISVEDYISHAQTLEARVMEDTLSGRTFVDVFGGLIEGLVYLHKEKGMLHRDLNFSNILVVREHPKTTIDIKEKLRDSKTKAVITDFANTHKIENVARRAIPSAGGHLVTDPFIYKELTGMPGRYSVASEMYSIGANMFYALTGKSIFDCEVFGGRKRAMVMIGGKETSMLDSKGHIDAAKFRKAVEENVGKLDRKYQNIIRKCFLSPLGEGYSDIEQLKKEFDKLKPNPAMRWLKMTGLVAGAAALIAAGAITVAYNLNSQKEQLNQEKEQLYQEMDLQTEVYESGREFDKDMQKLDKIISDAEIFRLSLEKMQANPKTRIIPDEAWEKLQKKQKEREEKKQEELKNLEKLNPENKNAGESNQ